MSQDSKIEWTDATWNPVRGCVKVSPGCANCYAETFAERWRGVKGHSYEQGFDLRLVPEKLAEPLSWKKPRRVFVNSMSDLFQDGVPFEYVDRVFAVMASCPQHTFQVLTKRAGRMSAYMESRSRARNGGVFDQFADRVFGRSVLPNVWLGVSVENQHFADERIPLLLQTPAAVRFISAEPLLGPISLRWLAAWDGRATKPRSETEFVTTNELDGLRRLDWVIVGGESGHGARPFDVAWARAILQQCLAAGVPVFMKQLGASPVGYWSNSLGPSIGTFTSKKGGDMAEWPVDLQVREFPSQTGMGR